VNAREIALAVVRDVFPVSGSNAPERGAQESLDYRARKAGAAARDRAFATELAYGAIKMRRTLDWLLEPLIGARAGELPPVIREILRLAVYEIAYTRADEHATVFEWVNLAKRFGHRGLGNLVNAVLRTFLRSTPAVPQRESFDDDDEYLAIRYSLPTWLVRQWRGVFGARLEEVCAGVDEPARAAVTVNTLKGNRDARAGELNAAGVTTAPSALVEESLLIDGGAGALRALEAGAAGAWWTQSESSAAVVAMLDPQRGDAVLDVCSGRGSKALQAGMRLAGTGRLACVERDTRKAETLARRCADAGVAAEIVVGDATQVPLLEASYDRALIDAPCSGAGLVGRHPEARWKKLPSDGERLSAMQRALLDRTARCVRGGGTLAYAVCSTDPRETTEIVEPLLSSGEFERGALAPPFDAFATPSGDVLIPPGIAGRDGFYVARLVRR